MLSVTAVPPLGGFREDFIDAIGPIVGRDRVDKTLTSMEQYIRSQAEAGAREAIPEIQQAVQTQAESTIQPYLIGAFVIGLVGVAFGSAAYFARK